MSTSLLAALESSGLALTEEAGWLMVRPAAAITDGLRQVIKANRDGLLQAVRVRPTRTAPLPQEGVTDADRAICDWFSAHGQDIAGPVATVELELVTIMGRTVAYRPGEWDWMVQVADKRRGK